MKTPEARLKDKVKAYLKEKGVWYFMPVPSGYGVQTLDFIGCYKGRFFAIETKAPGKKPTPRQNETMKNMAAAGAWVFWSDRFESLVYMLDRKFGDWDHEDITRADDFIP